MRHGVFVCWSCWMHNRSLSGILILFISSLFALLVGLGLYGYGLDYYGAYIKGLEWNIDRVNVLTYLGFKIATFTIFETHVGVYITTFILSLSTGFLIRQQMRFKKSYSLIVFLFLFLIAIHTWPVIMSTSNAMRQGLAMSFIFLALTSNSQKNYNWSIFFYLITILMHKSGVILVISSVFGLISYKIFITLSFRVKATGNFILGILLFIIIYYFLKVFIANSQSSRIIGADFSPAFVFIAFVYLSLSFLYKSILTNQFNLCLYYFSFAALPAYILGLSWQYERLGMIMIIPYILSFGNIINKSSYNLYLILAFLSLFFLTLYTGMYSDGLYYQWDPFIQPILNS